MTMYYSAQTAAQVMIIMIKVVVVVVVNACVLFA
jgi:hypothetical protein